MIVEVRRIATQPVDDGIPLAVRAPIGAKASLVALFLFESDQFFSTGLAKLFTLEIFADL